MTLIVSPGEDVLSSSSDDGDSGCLAGSPDLKEDSRLGKHHDIILTSKLKRLSLQDVKTLQVSTREGGGQEGVPAPADVTHLPEDNVTNAINLVNGENKGSHNGEESECDKQGMKEKLPDGLGLNSTLSNVDNGNDIVIGSKVKESRQNNEISERRLEGPAVISSPVVHLASQVHCRESGRSSERDFPSPNQKSSLAVQLTSPPGSNSCNGSSNSGLVGDDVTETLISAAHPSTSGKGCENRDEAGGYVEGEVTVGDAHTNTGVTVNGGEETSGEKDNAVDQSSRDNEAVSVDTQRSHPPEKEGEAQSDIHRAKQKINLMRQNFLSSLSADDDDFEQPDFIVLPHHSDHPEDEDWLGDGDNGDKTQTRESKVENNDSLDAEEREGKCSSEVTEVIAGPECGSHLTNGDDFVQEAGEGEGEGDESEEKDRGRKESSVVPGAASSSGECQVIQDTLNAPAFYGDEHLDREKHIATAQDNATTSLDHVPRENILSAKGRDNGQVSSVNALVMEASARLMEHEVSGRDEPTDILVTDGTTTLCGSVISHHVTCEGALTVPPETAVMGESDRDIATADSSPVVKPQSTPPLELPPSFPRHRPHPLSSPQSPCLFARDGSGSPPNYLKSQSASFVNLLMLQSRKHKRLHRLRLPDTSPTTVASPEEDQGEGKRVGGTASGAAGNDEDNEEGECNRRLLQTPQSPSAQPPQQLGNPHVRPSAPSPSSPSSPTSSVGAANTHCGTTDQLLLFHSGPPPPPPPPSPPPPPPLHGIHPHSSAEYAVGLSSHHPRQARLPLPLCADRDEGHVRRQSASQASGRSASDHLREVIKATSISKGLEDESQRHHDETFSDVSVVAAEKDSVCENDSHRSDRVNKQLLNDSKSESRSVLTRENDAVYENESHCSDNSCLGYLNFDHESFVDSDNEYDIKQKNRLREACKDIARALNTLPSPLPEDEDKVTPRIVCSSEVMYHDTRPQYRDQQVEAHLSDTDDPLLSSAQVRSCGTSTASDEDRRNSFYDNCSMNEGHCDCGRCDTSDVELDPKSQFPPSPARFSPTPYPAAPVAEGH
ncbi:uncharacterized protein LOC135214884 [Macrobrachium nipponense]|uniref:uncharacterized protein LOC135214884 n=1 Tax=Macrobrachium nipponense TaxID=159736 RepID=UPI0030C7C0E9